MKSKPSPLVPALLALTLAALSTQAQVNLWVGGTGSYNQSTNWDTSVVPGPGADAYVNNGGTVLVGAGDPDWTLANLWTGQAADSAGGSVNQSGGNVSVGGFSMGAATNTVGAYTLSGGSLSVSGDTWVGKSGQGSLTISDGTFSSAFDFIVAGAAGSTGTCTLSGGSLSATYLIYLGDGGQGSLTQSGGTITSAGLTAGYTNGASATVNLNGGSMTVTGPTLLANATNTTTVMTINGGAFNNGGVLQVANGPGSTATLNILAGTIQSTGNHNIGRQGVGICNLSGGTATYASMYVGDRSTTGSEGSYGTMNHSNGTLNVTGLLAIGNGLRTANHDVSGVYNLSGSGVINMTNGAPFVVGRSAGKGVMNMSGGTLNHNVDVTTGDRRFLIGSITTSGYAAHGVFNQSGGTVNNTVTNTVLGYLGAGSKGEYTLSGSGVANLRDLWLGFVPNAIGTFTLNGGTLIVQNILKNTNASTIGTFNFNGGTLQARVSTNAFMQGLSAANVLTNGAVIDTAGYDITIAQDLLNGGGGGGLTKLGAGTLTLAGTNTYAGDTVVQGGALQLDVLCLNSAAAVRLTNSAVLNLNFNGTNAVGAFVVDGVNQGSGLFNASTHVGLITGTGQLQVGVAAAPATLTNVVVVSGADYQFNIAGSGTQIIQATTNLANPAAWVSLATNSAPFSFTDTNAVKLYPQRFYRTVSP